MTCSLYGVCLFHQTELSRDPQRTPMQWTADEVAGFTSANSTWLPVQSPSANEVIVNVQVIVR